jgi:hypothetical protein
MEYRIGVEVRAGIPASRQGDPLGRSKEDKSTGVEEQVSDLGTGIYLPLYRCAINVGTSVTKESRSICKPQMFMTSEDL